jgi:hypothetical protein
MREEYRKSLLAQISADTAENWRQAYLDEDSIVRWQSNNQIPFADMLNTFVIARLITSDVADNCEILRDQETTASIAAYIEARKTRTSEQKAEEAYELRAAFGPGVEIVDMLTGETVTS